MNMIESLMILYMVFKWSLFCAETALDHHRSPQQGSRKTAQHRKSI